MVAIHAVAAITVLPAALRLIATRAAPALTVAAAAYAAVWVPLGGVLAAIAALALWRGRTWGRRARARARHRQLPVDRADAAGRVRAGANRGRQATKGIECRPKTRGGSQRGNRPCRGKRWGNSRRRSRARRPIRTSWRRPTSNRSWPRWSAATRTAWPDLRVDLAAFFAHVGTHWPDPGARTAASLAAALAGLEAEDLYLAFACTQDDTRALRAFERELEGELRAAFAKLRIEPARRDDARQQLWEKLFVGAPRPRILDYSGRSRLKFWFRVTVLRALLDDAALPEALARTRRTRICLLGAASSEPNPEIEHLKPPVSQASSTPRSRKR